jgi:hypothetical protein
MWTVGRLRSTLGSAIIVGIFGVAMAPMALAQCILSGGWSAVGCTNIGGRPSARGICVAGTPSDCYECEYRCNNGEAQFCSQTAQGPPQVCWGEMPAGFGGTDGDPILIDLDGNGYLLAGLDQAVLFDLKNDGTPATISWTRAGERDAFLCLDRNGNGRIDNGGELIGDAVLLANGQRAVNGFVVLAELDSLTLGGNEDGRISRADDSFNNLRLWIDVNHNAVSEPEELLRLADGGVMEIGLAYRFTARRDENGNIFRYQGLAKLRNIQGKIRSTPIYDVIFKKWVVVP